MSNIIIVMILLDVLLYHLSLFSLEKKAKKFNYNSQDNILFTNLSKIKTVNCQLFDFLFAISLQSV